MIFVIGEGVMQQVVSLEHFNKVKNGALSFFLFYTDSSADSMVALNVLTSYADKSSGSVYSVNASEVKEIHGAFGIDMVPALLVLRDGELSNVIFGLQSSEEYAKILSDKTVAVQKDGATPQKRVVVYTSDGCSWCTKATNYLKKMGIAFREVNVSRNPSEAERLVARTGQRGTPQLDIGGQYVVGFDQPKIDRLLGLN